jgi:hypothetical protein
MVTEPLLPYPVSNHSYTSNLNSTTTLLGAVETYIGEWERTGDEVNFTANILERI